MKRISLIKAHPDSFKPYGWVVQIPENRPDADNDEFTYWHSIAPFDNFTDSPVVSYFICKKRQAICAELECIASNNEAYINIGRNNFIIFVTENIQGNHPDQQNIKAFLFNENQTAIVKKDIWHWTPTPVERDSHFLLVLGAGNLEEAQDSLRINSEEVLVEKLNEKYYVEL